MAVTVLSASSTASTLVATVSVACSLPALIVTVRAAGAASMAPVSANATLTVRSAAGAGAACTVNSSASPSVTAAVVAAVIVTTGTGALNDPRAEQPANTRSTRSKRVEA